MAWTAPRSWVTDEVVTSTLLNTHVRDNLLALHHPYHTENTDIDVTNIATQVSLFTSAPVITGGDMGANGWIRAVLWGDAFYNAARTMTMRIKFGGTSVITTPSLAAAGQSANLKPWMLTVDIINQGATNVQWVAAHATFPDFAQPTSDFGATPFGAIMEGATAAIDTTANQTFDISVQWDTAATTYSWRKLCSRVQLMQG